LVIAAPAAILAMAMMLSGQNKSRAFSSFTCGSSGKTQASEELFTEKKMKNGEGDADDDVDEN
jgi:hypothetical protein